MPLTANAAVAVVAGYLLGSLSFAIVVSRLMRLPDPRSYGSKNPGTTNVLRTGKKVAAVLTLAGDAGKGWLAVWLAELLVPGSGVLAGLAAFGGHLYPVFHRFQGGKGVATAAGVLLGIDWRIGLGAIATWIMIAVFLRYSSLAAMVCLVFASVFTFWLHGLGVEAGVVVVMSAFLVWRHKDNIKRLVTGTESKLGAKEATPPDPNAASH